MGSVQFAAPDKNALACVGSRCFVLAHVCIFEKCDMNYFSFLFLLPFVYDVILFLSSFALCYKCTEKFKKLYEK